MVHGSRESGHGLRGSRELSHSPRGHRGQATAHGVTRVGPRPAGSRELGHSQGGHESRATVHGVTGVRPQPAGSRELGHGPRGHESQATAHGGHGPGHLSGAAGSTRTGEHCWSVRKPGRGAGGPGRGHREGGTAEGLGRRPRTRSAGPRLWRRGRGLGLKGPPDSPQVCPGEPRPAGGTEWPQPSLRAHARPHGHSWAAAVCG